jgi:hypothetical protein
VASENDSKEMHLAAIKSFDSAIDLLSPKKGDYPRAFFWRGLEHQAVGSYTKAIADYTKCVGRPFDPLS